MVFPLSDLYSFKNHPFHVIHDEELRDLARSIKQNGVLSPAIARPRPEAKAAQKLFSSFSGCNRSYHEKKLRSVLSSYTHSEVCTKFRIVSQREDIGTFRRGISNKMSFISLLIADI